MPIPIDFVHFGEIAFYPLFFFLLYSSDKRIMNNDSHLNIFGVNIFFFFFFHLNNCIRACISLSVCIFFCYNTNRSHSIWCVLFFFKARKRLSNTIVYSSTWPSLSILLRFCFYCTWNIMVSHILNHWEIKTSEERQNKKI